MFIPNQLVIDLHDRTASTGAGVIGKISELRAKTYESESFPGSKEIRQSPVKRMVRVRLTLEIDEDLLRAFERERK